MCVFHVDAQATATMIPTARPVSTVTSVAGTVIKRSPSAAEVPTIHPARTTALISGFERCREFVYHPGETSWLNGKQLHLK